MNQATGGLAISCDTPDKFTAKTLGAWNGVGGLMISFFNSKRTLKASMCESRPNAGCSHLPAPALGAIVGSVPPSIVTDRRFV